MSRSRGHRALGNAAFSKIDQCMWPMGYRHTSYPAILSCFICYLIFHANSQCPRLGLKVRLTLVSDAEAGGRAAVIGGEQQEEEVGRGDEEVGRLGSVVLSDHRGGRGGAVSYLQRVVVDLRLEPWGGRNETQSVRGGYVWEPARMLDWRNYARMTMTSEPWN